VVTLIFVFFFRDFLLIFATAAMFVACVSGAVVKMEHFQPLLDPRKQELLEKRFTGAKVRYDFFFFFSLIPF